MDEYLNNRQTEILMNLLANPANNGHLYAHNLQQLAAEFPQSGLLQVMLSRSDSEYGISHAAAYFDPKTLYSIVNFPESLAIVSENQVINEGSSYEGFNNILLTEPASPIMPESNKPAVVVAEDEKQEVESIDHIVDTNTDIHHHAEPFTDETEAVTKAPIAEEDAHVEAITITAENKSFYEDELVTEAGAAEQEQPMEVTELSSVEAKPEAVTVLKEDGVKEDESLTETATFELAAPPRDIDDDIYDEIVGIEDISFEPIAKPGVEAISSEAAPVIEEEHVASETEEPKEVTVNTDRAFNLDDEAERLILGNIAATDYFVFDKAVNDRKQTEGDQSSDTLTEPVIAKESPATETHEVSKYHDDAMPYTFMWWLGKTRKEHAGIYQPFKLDTSQAIKQRGADELQQQYYENIFHLSAVEELDKSTTQQPIDFDLKNKEDRIIKKFIVEEPHIGAPSGDKLDMENKARKSAEDQDEIVTETLARIYTDQMLYHKAINTYKKLMLKFPEKSRYFADQIEQLERKTN